MTERTFSASREALVQLYRRASLQRDTAVAARPDATAHDDPAAWVVAIVPVYRARVRRLALRRRRAFAQRLRALVAFVRAHPPEDDERTMEHPAPLDDTATRVVVATCSACRGSCCGNGGDHAFLRTRTVREFMAAHPALDDEAVVTAYTAFLPTHTLHPGCVYQSAEGCTLPPSMRSAICNAYLCVGLQRALDATIPGSTRGVYVAQREGDELRRGRLRSLPVLSAG